MKQTLRSDRRNLPKFLKLNERLYLVYSRYTFWGRGGKRWESVEKQPSRWRGRHAFAARFSLVIISALSTRELYLRGRGVVIIVAVAGDAVAAYGEQRRAPQLSDLVAQLCVESISGAYRPICACTYDDRTFTCELGRELGVLGNPGSSPARNVPMCDVKLIFLAACGKSY